MSKVKRTLAWLGIIAALTFNATAVAQAVADVCPESGKVESVVDGDIDDIVLDAGTLVCIKGGQTLVTVTADGTSTLAELLGTGQNVSHYTVLETPSTTTSTTTSIPTTTSTIPESTTTTEQSTTTTVPESSTTTSPSSESSTTVPSSTSTTVPPSTSTTVTSPPATPKTLPYTGIDLGLMTLLATVLLGGGWAIIRSSSERA